ncbi:MAG: replication protein [Leptospiraceae bacterium]|nr:replication protein [Leptospiraceae bacterium]
MSKENIFFPNTTQVPNFVFDVLMAKCGKTPTRFFVLLAIIRKTYGWQKHEDLLSLSQIITLTGMSKNAVKDALKFWQKEKVIKLLSKGDGRKISKYRCLLYDYIDTHGVIEKSSGGQSDTPTESVNDTYRGQSVTPQNQLNQLTKTNIQKEEKIMLPLDEENKISLMNLKTKFIETLKENGLTYNPGQKDVRFNYFTIAENNMTPQDLIDLIPKLIQVKKENPNDKFFNGICWNMSDLISYKAKINNAYKSNVVTFPKYDMDELRKEGWR